MKVAFTICANNYIAHAKTLADSFKEFHPDIPFYLALVDDLSPEIDYEGLFNSNVLDVKEIVGNKFTELAGMFSVGELCTSVKPEMIKHIHEKLHADTVLYIDPDIEVFSRFKEVFDHLNNSDVVLTPHICSPTFDEGHPQDKDLMPTGVYNLGFLAININENTKPFIDWWDKRVREFGFHDLKKGLFYDQIWLGYAPAFLDNVYVLRHLGYNVANWNLHERKLLFKNKKYYVNNEYTPLRFFHFSQYSMDILPSIAKYNNKFTTENRPDLTDLFANYNQSLKENGYKKLQTIGYKYGKIPEPPIKKNRFRLFARHVLLAIKALIKA